MAETDQAIWFHYKETPVADFGNSMQFAGLADSCGSIRSSSTRPKIFFVFAADEAFEIDAPNNVPRAHEV